MKTKNMSKGNENYRNRTCNFQEIDISNNSQKILDKKASVQYHVSMTCVKVKRLDEERDALDAALREAPASHFSVPCGRARCPFWPCVRLVRESFFWTCVRVNGGVLID